MSDGWSGWVSAGIAVVAAVFAYRSSQAAQRSANLAANAQQRAALRQTITTVHAIVEEAARAEAFADRLAAEQRAHDALSTSTGGSRAEMARAKLESNRAEIVSLAAEARALALDSSSLTSASERDLTDKSARLEGQLVQVRRIREDVERRVDDLASANRVIRDEQLKRMEQQ